MSPKSARAAVVNGRFLAKPLTGVTRVGREVLSALAEELAERPASPPFTLAAPREASVDRDAIRRGMPIVDGPSTIPQEQIRLSFGFPGATIVSLCNVTPLLASRAIVWIHDAHIFEAPESYGRFYRLWHTVQLRGSVLRRYEIVTVSHYSKERLVAHGANARHVHVIHNGGDHILRTPADPAARSALGLDGPFVLVMGSPAKHKNMPRALSALLQGLAPEVTIAAIGLHQAGKYTEGGEIPSDPRIRILPRIDDGALRSLYAEASCVVVPSLLEGFGLFASEALWAGGVLAMHNGTALPEVGGDASLYFDGMSPEDIAAKTRLAMQPETQARLRAAAVVQREKFKWRSNARALIELAQTM